MRWRCQRALKSGDSIVHLKPHRIKVVGRFLCGDEVAEAEAGDVEFLFPREFSAGEFTEVLGKHKAIDRWPWSPTFRDVPVFPVLFKEAEGAGVNDMLHAFFSRRHEEVVGSARLIVNGIVLRLFRFRQECCGDFGDMGDGIHAAHQCVRGFIVFQFAFHKLRTRWKVCLNRVQFC